MEYLDIAKCSPAIPGVPALVSISENGELGDLWKQVPDCVGCRQSSSSSLERSDSCYRRRCRRLHNDSVPSGRTKSENLRSLISGRSTNTIPFDAGYTVPIACVRALGEHCVQATWRSVHR